MRVRRPLAAPGQGATSWLGAKIKMLQAHWSRWSLARQFATCASIVLLPAMTLMGLWVSGRIQQSVTHSAATSAALYMENFVEPLVQDLAVGKGISQENVVRLSRLLKDTALGQRILTFKIWVAGDIVAASSRTDLIGQKFVPSAGLQRAWLGEVVSEFDHLKDVENQFEKNTGIPLLEVYIPIRARGSEQIIAVGEFYEKADDLKTALVQATILSWVVVAMITLMMLSALFAIVRRGSQTIELQRANLEQRVAELTRLLAENRQLRARAHSASARASENNEGYLRRLGADLHDGPAQLISLALLRLDEEEERPFVEATDPADAALGSGAGTEAVTVRSVLADALKEIRYLAAGLAVPEVDGRSLQEAIATVVARHQNITGTVVRLKCGALPNSVSPALKLCAYRFVQEGLSNAYRHAGGVGQSVSVQQEGDALILTVSDQGAGMLGNAKSDGLGVRGLNDRIESMGGSLHIETSSRNGTRLIARLPLTTGEANDA